MVLKDLLDRVVIQELLEQLVHKGQEVMQEAQVQLGLLVKRDHQDQMGLQVL